MKRLMNFPLTELSVYKLAVMISMSMHLCIHMRGAIDFKGKPLANYGWIEAVAGRYDTKNFLKCVHEVRELLQRINATPNCKQSPSTHTQVHVDIPIHLPSNPYSNIHPASEQ